MKTLAAKFRYWAVAQGLVVSRDYEPGCARLIKRRGLYVVETTRSINCPYRGETVGFAYPFGVTPLADDDLERRLGVM